MYMVHIKRTFFSISQNYFSVDSKYFLQNSYHKIFQCFSVLGYSTRSPKPASIRKCKLLLTQTNAKRKLSTAEESSTLNMAPLRQLSFLHTVVLVGRRRGSSPCSSERSLRGETSQLVSWRTIFGQRCHW